MAKMQIREGKTHVGRVVARKESTGQENGGKRENRAWWDCGKSNTLQRGVARASNRNLYAICKDDSENIEETFDHDEELQAWGLLGESENEQRQESISRQDKQKHEENQSCMLHYCVWKTARTRAPRQSLK